MKDRKDYELFFVSLLTLPFPSMPSFISGPSVSKRSLLGLTGRVTIDTEGTEFYEGTEGLLNYVFYKSINSSVFFNAFP